MKYKEVKRYYESGDLEYHYFLDENHNEYGEFRVYYKSGQIAWHHFVINDRIYGEEKWFDYDGTVIHHYLKDGNCNEIATVISFGKPATHTEEELIEIAKEHGLPLLSELPKTEAELTHWNLKYPNIPLLPITTD